MTKQTLTVATPYGTFSRTTAHAYTHLVIVERATDRTDAVRAPSLEPWGVWSWNGSAKLAQAEARKAAESFGVVRVVEIATGGAAA